MTFKNKKIQKFISTLIIFAILVPSIGVFSLPQKATAQFVDPVNLVPNVTAAVGTGTTAVGTTSSLLLKIKDVAKEIGKQILKAVARKAIAEMTKSTVNWINGGFHGAPLFLENPKSFFKDITKSQIKDFIQITGYDNLKYPFGKQYALDVIETYKRTLADNAAYSLEKVSQNGNPIYLEKLRIDFSTGGWNAFMINTQYGQNNPLGYTFEGSKDILRKIHEPEERIRDLVSQGQGFLSPQTCPDNPKYNNGKNEFRRPAFKFTIPANITEPNVGNYTGENDPDFIADYNQYTQNVATARNAAKTTWAEANTCPNGLVNTTPGAVVADKIMGALDSDKQTALVSLGVGDSISAIFNALTNHFLSDGLNSLATKINPAPTPDDFIYEGQTLGSPVDAGLNNDWSTGPDEEVDLENFIREIDGGFVDELDENGVTIGTKRIPGGIELTEAELLLINSDGTTNGIQNSNNLGILQLMDRNWKSVRELDWCQPGPDKGWEKRLQDEMDHNSTIIQEQTQDYSSQAQGAMRGLKFAVPSFKDWIMEKMEIALPSSILYLEAIKNIDSKFQRLADMEERAKTKKQALARLKTIKINLAAFANVQPTPGTLEEKRLITIRKSYNAVKDAVSSTASVEEARSIRDVEAENLFNTRDLTERCKIERPAAGYTGTLDKNGFLPTIPGRNGVLPSANTIAGTAFKQLVVWVTDDRMNKGHGRVEWDKQYANDKNNSVLVWFPLVFKLKFPPDYIYPFPPKAPVTTGKEIDQFCELPIIGGYPHETPSGDNGAIIPTETSTTDTTTGNTTTITKNADGSTTTTVTNSTGNIVSGPTTTAANAASATYMFNAMTDPVLYPNLPIVNALHLFHHEEKDKLWHWVNIALDCKVIYNANVLNYKKAGDIAF